MHDVLAFVAAVAAVVVVVIVCPETSQPPTGGSGPGLPPTSSSSFSSFPPPAAPFLHNSVACIHPSAFAVSAASFGCTRNLARMLRVSLTGFTALTQGEVNTHPLFLHGTTVVSSFARCF